MRYTHLIREKLMDIISIEGMPVAFASLSNSDLKDLQEYYLPIMFDIKESDMYNGYCRISKNERQSDNAELFVKYNETLKPYITDYVQSYNFDFSYELSMDTWYNVHAKHDHQQPHNHIVTNVPAFSAVCLIKQPEGNGGQLCFPTPSLSNHLKYLELDPNNNYPDYFGTPVEEGSLVFFPSCLSHFVTHNQTDELRAVFSSNIKVKNKNLTKT